MDKVVSLRGLVCGVWSVARDTRYTALGARSGISVWPAQVT